MALLGDISMSDGRVASAVSHDSGTLVPETDRKRIVRMVLLMFWILIFEGALRKWVAPRYSAYLYFVRDPFVLYTYYLAIRARVFASPHPLLIAACVIAGLGTAASAMNLASGNSQYTMILATYGFRNYFLYIPLAFVIARVFRYEDLCRLARSSMLALLIATPIAVLQFEAPSTSFLNVGSATDRAFQFENLASGSGKVRPAGTFTSVMGMTQLAVSTVALLLWAWSTSRRPRPVNPWLVRSALVAAAVAIAVSGSRTSFVHACLVILAGMSIAPLLPGMGTKFKSFLFPVLAVTAFALLFPVLLPEAFHTFADRWVDAAATENRQFELGWVGRAFYAFYDFFRLFDQVPVFGYGVGTAGNGAVNMGVKFNGVSVLKLAEEDWSRHVIELGPVLALLFILFRVSFGAWLGLRALRASLASGETLPLLLFVFCGVALIQGQITGHGLVNGFGWLYVGVCMAACNTLMAPASPRPGSLRTEEEAKPRTGFRPFPNLMQ